MFFNYDSGVYKIMSDQDMSNIVLIALEDDLLLDFRTPKHVADKLACLVSITPALDVTPDGGIIANVKNGLLNTETNELKPHTPEYVSLSQSPVVYDPEATCPTWNNCLIAWMSGPESEEKISLLQMFAGYCLSSSMTYDKALFLVGDGGNGKSTFVDTIARVIGQDSTSHIDLEDLYRQFGMQGLIGKRLNVIEEVHGNYYQSNKLKKLISGEPVTIDQKFKAQFTFRPQTKFVFAVNMMPRVEDTSTATERRIVGVVFHNNFRESPNVTLRGANGLLAQELSGILNWMLEGAKSLRKAKSFIVTQEQVELLKEYRKENSAVDAFIDDCLVFTEGAVLNTRELYDHYKEYCEKDNRKAKARITFIKEMKAFGSRSFKFSYREREYAGADAVFEGVSINDEWKSTSDVSTFNNYGNHN
jgi:putative DNA primase/helicase